MQQNALFLEKPLEPVSHPEGKYTLPNTSSKGAKAGKELIRFEEKKDVYIWVQAEDILLVKSADHYAKRTVPLLRTVLQSFF